MKPIKKFNPYRKIRLPGISPGKRHDSDNDYDRKEEKWFKYKELEQELGEDG